jgi:hypothetical protein
MSGFRGAAEVRYWRETGGRRIGAKAVSGKSDSEGEVFRLLRL